MMLSAQGIASLGASFVQRAGHAVLADALHVQALKKADLHPAAAGEVATVGLHRIEAHHVCLRIPACPDWA
jgi:hypothetical protein